MVVKDPIQIVFNLSSTNGHAYRICGDFNGIRNKLTANGNRK